MPIAEGGIKCPHCDRTFPNEHGLRVHASRVHKAEAQSKPRRPRRRRSAALVPVATQPERPATPVPVVAVNYCPNCGANIGIVAHALAIAEGVARGGS